MLNQKQKQLKLIEFVESLLDDFFAVRKKLDLPTTNNLFFDSDLQSISTRFSACAYSLKLTKNMSERYTNSLYFLRVYTGAMGYGCVDSDTSVVSESNNDTNFKHITDELVESCRETGYWKSIAEVQKRDVPDDSFEGALENG